MTMIERLRELEALATKPPWRDRSHALMRQWSKADGRDYRYVAFSGKADEDYTTGPLNAEDARLIAAMRNALPALLDVVEAVSGIAEREAEGLPCFCSYYARDGNHGDPASSTSCAHMRAALAALERLA